VSAAHVICDAILVQYSLSPYCLPVFRCASHVVLRDFAAVSMT
jgi:hypothetical protein